MAEKKTKVKKAVAKKPTKADVADVCQGLVVVRSFSKESHGTKFKDLAKQFAEKHGGEVVVR